MPRGVRLDLTGQRFGRLRALRFVDQDKHGNCLWECLCDPECGGCGTIHRAATGALRAGHTTSCGCAKRDTARQLGSTRSVTHGATRQGAAVPEYVPWCAMKQRCADPNRSNFKFYGGRGITVCERWRSSFENFLADMGPRPSPKHSIDRIDNDGNYEPSNCRWATQREQCRNTRGAPLIEAFGERLTAAEWSDRTGIAASTIISRRSRGVRGDLILSRASLPTAKGRAKTMTTKAARQDDTRTSAA